MSISASSALCEKLIVSRTNHQGHTLVDVLEQNKDKYFISGYELSNKMNPQVQALWKQTFESARSMKDRKIASHCDAGQFTMTLQNEGKSAKVHRGCYDEALYRQVILNIKKLRQEAQ